MRESGTIGHTVWDGTEHTARRSSCCAGPSPPRAVLLRPPRALIPLAVVCPPPTLSVHAPMACRLVTKRMLPACMRTNTSWPERGGRQADPGAAVLDCAPHAPSGPVGLATRNISVGHVEGASRRARVDLPIQRRTRLCFGLSHLLSPPSLPPLALCPWACPPLCPPRPPPHRHARGHTRAPPGRRGVRPTGLSTQTAPPRRARTAGRAPLPSVPAPRACPTPVPQLRASCVCRIAAALVRSSPSLHRVVLAGTRRLVPRRRLPPLTSLLSFPPSLLPSVHRP